MARTIVRIARKPSMLIVMALCLIVSLMASPTVATAATETSHTWDLTQQSQSVTSNSGLTMTFNQNVMSIPEGRQFTTTPSWGTVSNNNALNPGTQNFSLTAGFSAYQAGASSNVAQKGLFGDHQVKIQLIPTSGGMAQCRLKGAASAYLITSPVTGLTDGQPHVVTCAREGSSLVIIVDGVKSTFSANIGTVVNTKPLMVGFKTPTAKGDPDDQFYGVMRDVTFSIGSDAVTAAQQVTAFERLKASKRQA